MGELKQSSFWKPPTGPARSGRPDDNLRGYPESTTTGRADFALSVIMDPGSLAMLEPGMTGGVL